MSLSYLLGRGVAAAAIPDHPMAETWARPGLDRARMWLEEVGPEGEWYESAHYSQVSAFAMTGFAVTMKNAGFEDLFLNANLKKWAMWLAEIYTPRDPMEGRRNRRATPPIGRATAGVPWGLSGLMSKATAETDPAYSRILQWAWAGTDYTENTADHLGGFEPVYFDRSLPMETPGWTSKLFPQMGPLFRNGVGSAHENYLVFHAFTGAGVRPSELGGLPLWFARGAPVAGSFPGGYRERHQMCISRVNPPLAWREGEAWPEERFGCQTDVQMAAFSALPRQGFFAADYVHRGWRGARYGMPRQPAAWPPVEAEAAFPIFWRRNVLYIQDDRPDGLNYLVLRDVIGGGQPTLWQMWTVSGRLGTPDEVRFAEGAPDHASGNVAVPARRLAGNRFTAVGRFHVDLEYYVAAPAQPEAWTMRFGHDYRDYSVAGHDYRDLLQLRQQGDGDYFVAMFPRLRDEPAPEFSTLGNGAVIRVSGDFGTDYCFLSGTETEAEAGQAAFRGLAGSVQNRSGHRVLALGNRGEVRYGAWSVSSERAVSLRVEDERLTVRLPGHAVAGGNVVLRTPGAWQPAPGQPGILFGAENGAYTIGFSAGETECVLFPAD